ncbi:MULTISPECIES: TRADD-N-associated membrane domain-containing protein [unclassified Microcoleus]|uniref:TRADD-N-associated membrane domain-containing protein n=1 Tax=unclassified Microcoleus TaxID=2642155 RepID=UPI002FD10363
MNFNLFGNSQPDEDYSEIKKQILRESLRQVRHSYNLALFVTAASAMVIFGGFGLLFCEKISEATLTASGGLLTSLGSVEFAKQKKKELQQMMDDLED